MGALATLIFPAALTQVTELRSSPARSCPSTLTSVLPLVLTCVDDPVPLAAAVLDAGELPLSSEQPTSTAAAGTRPPPATRMRFVPLAIELPFASRVALVASS